MKMIFLNIAVFITIFIFLLIIVLYNYLAINLLLRKYVLFGYKIESKRRIFGYSLFILTILTYIYWVLLRRFARVGFYFNIYEVYYTLKDWFYIVNPYNLSYSTIYLLLYPILLILLVISIIIFWTVLVANVTDILRMSLISLYVYGLSFDKFRWFSGKLFDLIMKFRRIVYILFPTSMYNLIYPLHYLWTIVPFKLESLVYRKMLIMVIIFDIYTNFGNISLLFDIMPWYYMYTILRRFLMFIRELILDLDYWESSTNLYKNDST